MRSTSSTILVVDDDPSSRLLLEKVLKRADFDVALVDSAEDGLEFVKANDVNLVISDKNLPGMDGLVFLQKAKEVSPHLKSILVTGFPTPETREVANHLGVVAFIEKPFNIQELVSTCRRALA